MHSLILAALLCWGAPAPERLPNDPRIPNTGREENVVQFRKKWQKMFGLAAIDDPFYLCLSYADPQPEEKFVPFRQEQLSKSVLRESEAWLRDILREGVSPFAKGVRPCKYYAGRPGESDLLLYQWEAQGYRLQLQESCCGFLLRVQLKDRPFNIKKGVPVAEVVAALRHLLNLKDVVPKGQTIAQVFRLPKVVRKGVPFDNLPLDRDNRYLAAWSPRWSKCIVGFLGNDGLYLLVPRRGEGSANALLGFRPNWLRDGLVGPDGKTRVLKQRPDIRYREK